MVRFAEDLKTAEIQTLDRDEISRTRRQPVSRRSNRMTKVKKGNWKRGMHQRRNKRFAW